MKSTDQHSSTTSHQSRQAQSAKTHFFDPENEQGFFSNEGATYDRPSFFSGNNSADSNAGKRDPFLQAKSNTSSSRLRLGRPNDHYEQEADATADRVVEGLSKGNATHTAAASSDSIQARANTLQRKPIFESDAEPNVQTKVHQPITPAPLSLLQRQIEEGQEEEISTKDEESLQRKPIFESAGDPEDSGIQRKATPGEDTSTVSTNFEQRLNSTKGGGQAMPDGVRSGMEEQFGADFSGVKVHTGQEASKLNQEVGAQAFTHGNDIYFDEGNYQPDNESGQHLLAHELTHTVQQGASVQRKPIVSNTSDQIQGGWLSDGVEWIKGKIADGLNWAAEKLIPGYSLLNVILGKNMITGKPVQRTGANIIKGYMQLIPVIGTILLNELKETDALTQASSWVEGQVAKFGIDFDDIARRINLMWEAVSIWNSMKTNARIFQKYIGPVLGKFLAFSSVVEQKCKELRLEGALRLVGAHELLASLKKSPEAMKRVIDKPSLIFEYFIKALKQGFQQFKDNFGKHFKAALFGWLFGKAAEMGIQMPQKFNIVGLFHLIAQIVGATYNFIRTQAVKALGPKGEKIISTLEKTAGVVFDLVTQGPKALWELVKEKLANFKEMLFSQITSLVTGEIIKAAVLKLVSMLNPAGAIVQLALTIYKVVKYFIDWWDTIKEIATGVLGAITKVALGSIGGAANFIEGLFGKAMKLIIAFLARIFGLGGIAQKVKKLIKKIAGPVQKAIGKVVKFIVNKGKKLLGKLFGKGKASKGDAKGVKYTQKDKDKGLKAFEQEEKPYVKDNSISQENAKKVASKVQKKHPVFKSIKVIDGGKDWDYEYVFRKTKSTKSKKDNADAIFKDEEIKKEIISRRKSAKESLLNSIPKDQDWVAIFPSKGRKLKVKVNDKLKPATLKNILPAEKRIEMRAKLVVALERTILRDESAINEIEHTRGDSFEAKGVKGKVLKDIGKLATKVMKHIGSVELISIENTAIPRKLKYASRSKLIEKNKSISKHLYQKIAKQYKGEYSAKFGEQVHHIIPLYLGGSHEIENLLKVQGEAKGKVSESVHAELHKMIDEIGLSVFLENEGEVSEPVKLEGLDVDELRKKLTGKSKLLFGMLYTNGTIKYIETDFLIKKQNKN